MDARTPGSRGILLAGSSGFAGGIVGTVTADGVFVALLGTPAAARSAEDLSEVVAIVLSSLPGLLALAFSYGLVLLGGFAAGTLAGLWIGLRIGRLPRRGETVAACAALMAMAAPAALWLAVTFEPLWPAAVLAGAVAPALARYLAVRTTGSETRPGDAVTSSP